MSEFQKAPDFQADQVSAHFGTGQDHEKPRDFWGLQVTDEFLRSTRKKYRCEYCFGPIPEGDRHCHFRSSWQGEWQNWRMPDECAAVYEYALDYSEDGFTRGEGKLLESVKKMLEEER